MPEPDLRASPSAELPADADQLATAPRQSLLADPEDSNSIWSGVALAAIAVLVLFGLYGLVLRSFMRVDINYNEGWNAYNATLALTHHLYPIKHGWTTVNYPFLSFFIIGQLSRIHGDPLFIGRILSLAGLLLTSIAGYCIVRELAGHRLPALFAALYFLWFIVAKQSDYVGMDDPQMLAQAVMLCALYLYLRYGKNNWSLAAVAFLFVVGGNIKHNLLAAPLAVFVDLILASRSRALRYAFWGVLFLAGSVFVNQWAGGPFFLAQILTPREYSLSKLSVGLWEFLSIAVPLCICAVWSVWSLVQARYRILGLYFLISFAVGLAFYGGSGTVMNMFFDFFMAISLIMGIILDSLWYAKLAGIRISGKLKWAAPLLLWQIPCVAYPPVHHHELRERQNQFDAEVAFLRSQPGPAICQSLSYCYFAGKPYVYDPFDSTSLVDARLLDPTPMVQRIEDHEFGAIQTNAPLPKIGIPNGYFPAAIFDAIEKNYRVAMEDAHCVIYVPRQEPES